MLVPRMAGAFTRARRRVTPRSAKQQRAVPLPRRVGVCRYENAALSRVQRSARVRASRRRSDKSVTRIRAVARLRCVMKYTGSGSSSVVRAATRQRRHCVMLPCHAAYALSFAFGARVERDVAHDITPADDLFIYLFIFTMMLIPFSFIT